MAIVAPLSKYKKGNFKIGFVVLIVGTIWFSYDGYFNQSFIDKHTGDDGAFDDTLVINRKAPYFLGGAAILLAGCFWATKDHKIVADEDGLTINGKQKISYDSIQKIDKTHFDSKGYFTITYKDPAGKEVDRKISDRTYDNLGPILDDLIAKIT